MDLEETQILNISLDDETEDEADKSLLNKNLVATLSLTNALHGHKNVLFPIYTGINKIGRSSECEISIESEFLSKHHCTIEYINATHLIFDCGSRNKTKKNKMFLIPEVRYELRNGDVLKFGNICFEYKFNTNYNLKRSNGPPTSTPLPNNNQTGFENKMDDNGDSTDECDNESTMSRDLLTNADNEMAAMKFYDVSAINEDDGDHARTSDDIKTDVHKDEIPQGSISTSESLEEKILVESPRNLKEELTIPETFKADGDDKAKICHSNASTPDQVPPLKLKLFVDSSPEEDKKIPTEGNAHEPLVPQTQADSSMTPIKANDQTNYVAVFDTPFMYETPDQKDDNNVEESIKDANHNNPHFAAETQDIDEVSSHKSKRKRFTDSLVGSMGITEIPETPEKDQFDCHTPVAQASNLKLRNQRDSSNYSDDTSLSQDDVELRRKLFFDDNDDRKFGGVDKDTPKDVCEDTDEASDEGKIRSCASTNEGDGVASLVSVSEDVESTGEEVTGEAKILINTEVGSACAEDLQENIEKEAMPLDVDGSFNKEAEIMTAGAKYHRVSDENVDAGEVGSNQNNNLCDYKIATEMLPQCEIGRNVETITESERGDKLKDATLEGNSTCESKDTESKDLKSFQGECQGTSAAEENKSSDDIEGISKCPEEIDIKPFRSRNVSDVSLEAKSPSGNLFPKSYAHKHNALKSPVSSKNSKQTPISSRTQNLSLNIEKCKSPSPNKRSASLKQIASKKLLKKSTSLSRKKLFGNVDNEFELNCDDDQFDSASQRRKSKEDSVEEEATNAKVIQSIVTESLSTSAFKKKLKEGSKNTKRKQLKSILADLKVTIEDNTATICDSKESSSERRVSTRCNKGKTKTDPRFVFSHDKTLENIDGNDPKAMDSEVALKNRKKNVLTSINLDVNENASKIDVNVKESNSGKNQLQDKGSTCKNSPKVSQEIPSDMETQEKASNDFKTTPDSVIASPVDVLPSKTKGKKMKRKSNARTLSDDVKEEEIEGDHIFDNKFETPTVDERREIDMDCVKKEIVMNEKDKDAHNDLKLPGNKRTVKGRKESLKVEGQVNDEPKAKKRNTCIALDASVVRKDALPMNISTHVPHNDGDDNDFLKKNTGAKPYPKTRKSKSREVTTAVVDVDANRHRLENTVTKPTDDEIEATKSMKAKAEDDGSRNEGRKHQKRKHDNKDDEGSSKKRKCTDDKDGDDEKVMRTKSLRKSKAVESLKSEEGDGMDCESSISDFVVSRRSNRSQKVSNVATRQEETIKILFTGVREEDALKTLRKLGGEEAESVLECTHIISDQVRRTIKFLCGVARGIPIVSTEWLKECKKQKKFIDAWSYLIKDDESERKFQFDLKESLTRSAANKLFESLTFHITKNVKPEPSEMKEIINCAGGKVVDSMPRKYSDKLIVISCVDDTKLCKNLHALEVPVVSPEFVMTGVLRHVVDPLEFKLSVTSSENKSEFNDSQKSQRVTQRRKR